MTSLERRAARDAKRDADPYALTPAAKAALAYVAILGNTPKGCHIDTRMVALHYTVHADYTTTKRFYNVPAEHHALYFETPLWKVHTALLAAGFRFCGNVHAIHGRTRIKKDLRYERFTSEGHGFGAVLLPSGYLMGFRVRAFKELWEPGDRESVKGKNAGMLPTLFVGT